MKKRIKAILCTVMAVVLMLCVTGCGDNAKKKEATEAYNNTVDAYNEVADLINQNADVNNEDLLAVYQQMGDMIAEYKVVFEGGTELTDEGYDELIGNLAGVDEWLASAKQEIEMEISAANS